jgi:hypothetical protein
MRALPNLEDEAAMLRRGRAAALISARNDALECLRDACTRMQSVPLASIDEHATAAEMATARLRLLAQMAASLDE